MVGFSLRSLRSPLLSLQYKLLMAKDAKKTELATTTPPRWRVLLHHLHLMHACDPAEKSAAVCFRREHDFHARQRHEFRRGCLVHPAGHSLRSRAGNVRRAANPARDADAAVYR